VLDLLASNHKGGSITPSLDRIRKYIKYITDLVRKLFSKVAQALTTLAGDLFSDLVEVITKRRLPKKTIKFIKKYSLQLSLGAVLAVFLTVSVGEGQAYEVGAADFSSELNLVSDGFIGKPQLLATQTVLTGEVAQLTAIIYTVEKGDSLSSVANRYNLSVGSILDANNMSALEAEKIKPGSELVIPAEDTNSSLAWLEDINAEKERQKKLAEAARQKELARQANLRGNSSSTSGSRVSYRGGYTILGTMRGSYNGGLPGWCTWYAHYKRPDLPNGLGNARDYLRNARAKGLATGSVARPGALFVSGESGYGHVGYVESVSGGYMTVSEMNYTRLYEVSRRTVPVSLAWGFVY